MTPEQRQLLKPWGDLYGRLLERLERMEPADLRALYDAVSAASETNCWFATYRVSGVLKREIKAIYGRRTLAEIRAADEAEKFSK